MIAVVNSAQERVGGDGLVAVGTGEIAVDRMQHVHQPVAPAGVFIFVSSIGEEDFIESVVHVHSSQRKRK